MYARMLMLMLMIRKIVGAAINTHDTTRLRSTSESDVQDTTRQA
jgi:hypothetical protein